MPFSLHHHHHHHHSSSSRSSSESPHRKKQTLQKQAPQKQAQQKQAQQKQDRKQKEAEDEEKQVQDQEHDKDPHSSHHHQHQQQPPSPSPGGGPLLRKLVNPAHVLSGHVRHTLAPALRRLRHRHDEYLKEQTARLFGPMTAANRSEAATAAPCAIVTPAVVTSAVTTPAPPPPPAASTAALSVEAVDSLARQLQRRSRGAGPDFDHVSAALLSLRLALKHLHAEAADPDSLLNQAEPARARGGGRGSESGKPRTWTDEVATIAGDCGQALRQLDSLLAKQGHAGGSASSSSSAESGGGSGADGYPNNTNNIGNGNGNGVGSRPRLDEREREMLDLIRMNLSHLSFSIEGLLDRVQLHNQSMARTVLEHADNTQLDRIKDTLDAVAARLQALRQSGATEEELWPLFQSELEKEGFSSQVLRAHKVGDML